MLALADPKPMLRQGVNVIIRDAKAALESGTGYSMLRLGHCETRIMGFETLFPKAEVLKSIRMQWGLRDYDTDELRKFSSMMRSAFQSADAVGVHDWNRAREGDSVDLGVLERASQHLAVDLGLFPSAVCTTALCHWRLGETPAFFDLLRGRRVVLVTCRDVKPRLLKKIGARFWHWPRTKIHQITLTGEFRKLKTEITEPQYPVAFNRIMEELPSVVKPGTIVLVGAGLVGKVFCAEAKRLGGVALDLGSLFDAWVGENTRGNGFPPGLELPS